MTSENKLIGKRGKIMDLIVIDFQEIFLQRGIKKEYICFFIFKLEIDNFFHTKIK